MNLSLIVSLIPTLVIIAIILAFRMKDSPGAGQEGMSAARQVWLYLLTFISLGIFSAGIGQLLTLLFDVTIISSYITSTGGTPFDLELLAMGLAMTLIGGPLWFLFWNSARKRIRQNPLEANSLMRKLFLSFVMLVTALTFLPTVSSFFQWLLSGPIAGSFSSSNLATVIVTGVIWFYHFSVSSREGFKEPGAKTLQRLYVYTLSAFGLIWLVSGFIVLVNTLVLNLPIWGSSFISISFWNDATVSAITLILFGGIAWYFHWFQLAKGDFDSALRQVYFYLFTIAGGAILTLVSTTIVLHNVLSFIFGSAADATITHFQFLGWSIPAIITGAGVWLYHRALSHEEAAKVEERSESARRVYIYLMNFLGLGTTIAGLVMLFGIVLEFIIFTLSTTIIPTSGWWREQLAVCLALLLVGAPMFVYFWNSAFKRAQTKALEEFRSLARRIFLYTTIGISIVALAAGLVNIVYQIISGVLDASSSVSILQDSRWSLQAILVAGPVLWYFWQVLKGDQRQGSEAAIAIKNVILVALDPDKALSSMLSKALGYKIKLLQVEGDKDAVPVTLTEEEITTLATQIKAEESDNIMVVEVDGKFHLLPYQLDS
jgi:hypothetical protein